MLIIVVRLRIVRLVIDSTHHISSRKPPAVVLVVPYRPNLTVIEKPYRLLAHYSQLNKPSILLLPFPFITWVTSDNY